MTQARIARIDRRTSAFHDACSARIILPMPVSDHATQGGKARAAKLTPEQRTASARAAARVRWQQPEDPIPKRREDRENLPDIEWDDCDPHLGRL